MVWTPLVLDTFLFDEASLEVPEAYGDLGGSQSIEQHDFPGGVRTHRAYGYFPAVQKWKARFHGVDASDRAEGIKRILFAGREVKLQYGNRSWLGRVARFSPTVRHNWLFEYELEFWPRVDNSAPGPTLPPVTNLGTVLALHLLALQSLIKYGLDPAFVGQAISLAIGGPIGFLISQVQDSVAAAGGVISNISAANKQQNQLAALSAMQATQPFVNSTDPTQSSPAADAQARIMAIATLMTAAQPAVTVLRTVNPNLVVLAAQYYGDAGAWRTIATANGLADPQPIGNFNLTIPQPA